MICKLEHGPRYYIFLPIVISIIFVEIISLDMGNNWIAGMSLSQLLTVFLRLLIYILHL